MLGLDSRGIPTLCAEEMSVPKFPAEPGTRALPAGTRSWAAIPSVVFADGMDTFDVEVNANGAVLGVTIDVPTLIILGPGQVHGDPTVLPMLDDGQGADRVAGDFVFSAGPFRYNTDWNFENTPGPGRYPEGASYWGVGLVEFEETDNSTTTFLIGPKVGLLRPDVAEVLTADLSGEVAVSAHVININTDNEGAANMVRGVSVDYVALTSTVFAHLPDAFDFITVISTARVEWLPRLNGWNYVSGTHFPVKINYTGMGLPLRDDTAFYGSAGKLMGVSALDVIDRGFDSHVWTHEIAHQWGSYIGASFPAVSAGAHYTGRSNVDSVIGGWEWDEDASGTLTLDCSGSSSGRTSAAPINKYLMGLIDGSLVPPLRAYDASLPYVWCDAEITSVTANVTIDEIQAEFGVRTPGPATSQKDFRIAVVAPSFNRFLTKTEMTFYEMMAREYTAPIPAGDPDPGIRNDAMASIERFFGEGTTWSTALPLNPSLSGARHSHLYE